MLKERHVDTQSTMAEQVECMEDSNWDNGTAQLSRKSVGVDAVTINKAFGWKCRL